MIVELSPGQRKALKSSAHRLHPVVTIGDKGLTDAVLREIDVNLKSHELIKVRASSDDRPQRESWLEAICESLDAAPVQHIGKVFVIWRERPEEPKPAAPVRTSSARRPPVRSARPIIAARSAEATPATRPARTRPGTPRSQPRATRRSGRATRSP